MRFMPLADSTSIPTRVRIFSLVLCDLIPFLKLQMWCRSLFAQLPRCPIIARPIIFYVTVLTIGPSSIQSCAQIRSTHLHVDPR